MQETREKDLIYFSSMAELKEAGYICVGVLFEDRELEGERGSNCYYGIKSFINEDAKIGNVYQTVNDVTVWQRKPVKSRVCGLKDSMARKNKLHMGKQKIYL